MKLPQLPHDKANHFVYGFLIFIVTMLAINIIQYTNLELDGTTVKFLPLTMVLLVAVLREIYGKVKQNRWEIMDIAATIFPAIILTII
jgi:hypothetical protein